MSLKKLLRRLLLFCVLQIGVLGGMKMTPEEIERLMELMNRTEIVRVIKKETD